MRHLKPTLGHWDRKSSRWSKYPILIILFLPLLLLVAVIIYFGLPKAIGVQSQGAQTSSCATVTFAETGWTDISATTAITKQVLQGLGYQPKSYLLSVPVAFNAMSTGEIDAFLGFWQPSMNADIKPFLARDDVAVLHVNLQGALYGLAVPQYLYEQGLHSFSDIARFKKDLNAKIYGVEPGNDANRILLEKIEANEDDLKGFQLVESSEQAMLSEVDAAIEDKRPIVFLAWQPHPMNERFKISYLKDEGNWFGAGEEGASVATVIRRGYQQQCPNVSKLLENLSFDVAMENHLMDKILNHGQTAESAARQWLQLNPQALQSWLKGVKTIDGDEGLHAVEMSLKSQ